MSKISKIKNIFYYGVVSGEKKRELLWDAHIFCLPTYYKFEAQPLAILEAYASGCVVLTTPQGGIKDIFINEKNGLYINDGVDDLKVLREMLKSRLNTMILNIDRYKEMALLNFHEAQSKYREHIFCESIDKIFR